MDCSVEVCDRTAEHSGLCHSHAEWKRRNGTTPTHRIKRQTLEERLMAKVEKQVNGCWLWTGATDGDKRYGCIGSKGKLLRTHRVSYELFKGPIPEGLSLDHLCKVTLCCNPEHLEPVTHKVNVLRGDSIQAKNAVKTHCPRGHAYDIALKNGGRWCSICARVSARERTARYRARKRAEKQ